jgi:hypothetical protein
MLGKFFLESSADRPPLRVGLLLDSLMLPSCSSEVLDQIQASNFARLVLVVLDAADSNQPHSWLYRLYERWDARHLGERENPLAIVDGAARLRGVDSVNVSRPSRGSSAEFDERDLARIRDAGLDVLVSLGSARPGRALEHAARYGVWSLRYGGCATGQEPTCFWEVVTGDPLTRAELVAHIPGSQNPLTLCRAVVDTEPGMSQVRNQPRPYWAASGFVIQKLHELHRYGWDHVTARSVQPEAPAGTRLSRRPSNWDMARWLVPTAAARVARRLLRRPLVSHWRIGLRRGGTPVLERRRGTELDGFRWIDSPVGRSYADPFLVQHDSRTWLFFEEFDYSARRGFISVAEVLETRLGDVVPVLSLPYHVSYPCVFRDRDEFFMIPESGNNETIDLYRCRRFPHEWTYEKELMRGRAVDTTVWIEDGRYWFFVTFVEPRALPTQLWLFSAESLTGTWTPHPANPISADVRNSRGAGAIFRHQGALIRPSQDGSVRYGRSFTLNRIAALSPSTYEEAPAVGIEPPAGFIGTHSYSSAGQIEAIDGNAMMPAAVRG